ncbi:ferredoxin [Agilicoccus flavus]|uniref:ferredoxin n=1 Tax=Agilicoccus flavus TaxID=2775968 RepID=UPI001CF6E14C|nr:ferredoxin [Agilicoccus flavus]
MRIEIHEDTCIGAGQCVMSAPEVFDQREDDGVAVLRAGDPGSEQEAAVRDAAAMCPSGAISVRED